MNKPLLSPHPRRRISTRETALALVALACAAGWLHERMNNRDSEEVQPFIDSLHELRRAMRHDPDAIVNKTVKSGEFFVSCRMRRAGTDAPRVNANTETGPANDGKVDTADPLPTDHKAADDPDATPAATDAPVEPVPRQPASEPSDSTPEETPEDKSP